MTESDNRAMDDALDDAKALAADVRDEILDLLDTVEEQMADEVKDEDGVDLDEEALATLATFAHLIALKASLDEVLDRVDENVRTALAEKVARITLPRSAPRGDDDEEESEAPPAASGAAEEPSPQVPFMAPKLKP